MATIPYVLVTGKISKLFEKIQTTGTPDKVPIKWLESIGLKSTNDRPLLTLLKSLGFIDASGTPTQLWSDYRNTSKAKDVMTMAIKTCYGDLFKLYPNANAIDDEALRNYFRTASGEGEDLVKRMVTTFKNLCSLADFSSSNQYVMSQVLHPPASPQAPQEPEGFGAANASTLQPMVININIQLTLPETENKDIYENLFSSLRKNLLSPEEKD